MSGHSKWSKVKRFKGAIDAKRGKIFSKLSKEITIAAKTGGGDPNANPRLRSAIQAARAQSMPNDNIERAIKRGTGEGNDAQNFEEIVYEGYAPSGVAVIVEAATDNKNRTAAEIRSIFSKNNGNLDLVEAFPTCSIARVRSSFRALPSTKSEFLNWPLRREQRS